MEETQIIVDKEKITTIRLTEKTKKQLETYAVGKETHEQIIHRLMKLRDSRAIEEGTQLVQKNKVTGIQYQRIHTVLPIELKMPVAHYQVVCTHNDLHIFFYLRNQPVFYAPFMQRQNDTEWEVDLELVNIMVSKDWESPERLKKEDERTYLLIYLSALKFILEKSFMITLYEFETEDDYLNVDKWQEAYKRNHLSMESFYNDVQKKVRL